MTTVTQTMPASSMEIRPVDAAPVVVVVDRNVDPLVHKAACELRDYLRLLFGCPTMVRTTRPKVGLVFRLGIDESGDFGTQDYVIHPRCQGQVDVCELVGGSPIAVLWAVYDLVQQWGVEYLTSGDVLPAPGSASEKAGALRLPAAKLMRRPIFEMRAFRIVNDMVSSGILWSLVDYEKLFDQLVKLRFNTVHIATFPHQPWAHWSFRGIERREADLLYGMRHLIHERSVGKELFGQLGHYTNPDFRGCESYEDRLQAGKRFMHGLMAAAHRRGLQCVFGHILTDFPEQMKRQLPQWSDVDSYPPQIVEGNSASGFGIALDPTHYRYGHLMTPTNQVYVEMVESWLAVHLEEYPEIDGLFLGQSEFPAGVEDYQHCWDELDRRHGLSSHFDLDSILLRASSQEMGLEGRSLREAKGAIATIRLLDMILNERTMIRDRLSARVKLYSTFFSESLMPVLPHVFDPQRFEFVAISDYLPQRVAQKMDQFAFAADSPLKFHLITTITDDNVGFLPQITAPSLHRAIQSMREYGLSGYWFRQFNTSKVEPVMAYVTDAAWNEQAAPQTTYRRQIERICGAAAVEPMLRALNQLEQATPAVNKLTGLGFEVPNLIRKVWEPDGPDNTYKIEDIPAVQKELAAAIPPLQEAREQSHPRGRSYVDNLLNHVKFACLYLDAINQVIQARQCEEHVRREEAKPPRQIDIEHLFELKNETARRLADAVDLLEKATRIWAQTVTDPTDLGTLLGLNVYGLDYLRGKADEFRLKAEVWGFRII